MSNRDNTKPLSKLKLLQTSTFQSLKTTSDKRTQRKSRNYQSLSPLTTTIPKQSMSNSTMAFTTKAFQTSSNNDTFTNKNKTKAIKLYTKVSFKAKPESNDKLRKTKLKIHKIIQANPLNQCSSFKIKNDLLNEKIFDHIGGDFYHKRQLTYHNHFSFDKNELGEAHDKLSMLMKFKPINLQLVYPIQQIGLLLTEEEKKMVMLDPDYFLKENQSLLNYNLFKARSLSETLQNEDNPNQDTLFNNNAKNQLVHHYKNYEPNYTFNIPCTYMEDEIQERHKVIDEQSKKMVNQDRDRKLKTMRDGNKLNLHEVINKDVTKMIRKINTKINKGFKVKLKYRKRGKRKENITEEDKDEREEISYNESRNKLLLKNFLRLRNEDKEAAKRKKKRNIYGNNPLCFRTYLSELTENYLKPKQINK